jgi:RimJ/RimL family protein N-acetyltransferase
MTSSVRLSTGAQAEIVPVTADDAPETLAYLEAVAGESSYLSFGPGELAITAEEQAAFLRTQGRAGSGLMLKAVVEGRIVGLVSIRQSPRSHVRHVGELGLSVLRAFSGAGLGRALCERAIAAAAALEITRIELKVREDNDRAIRLYESLGFVHEGRLRHAFRAEGRVHDEFLMALVTR